MNTIAKITCPHCGELWGEADIHWGEATDPSHFTRKDGTHPDSVKMQLATEWCTNCGESFNLILRAMKLALCLRDQIRKEMQP